MLGRRMAALAIAAVVGGACSGGSGNQPTSGPPSQSAPPGAAAAPSTTEAVRVRDFSAVAPIIEAFVVDNGLAGAGLIVVDRADGVVYEDYWGEFSSDRVSLIASASKMITAGVLLHLHDQGLLDVDAPVGELVEWGAANPDITPAQLVSNSSGLVGLAPDPAYAPYLCQFLPVGDLQDCARTIFTTPDDDGDVVAPDTEFRYGGGQWQVAGAVAEVVSGRTWAELIDEIYVRPCGLESLGYSNPFVAFAGAGSGYPAGFGGDPATLPVTANPNLEGGAHVSAPDYAALLLMHLRDGRCGENQVLSPEAVARLHADRIGDVYGGDARDDMTGYGMGWWVDRRSGRLSDPGAYGAFPWLDPDGGYGAYLVIEADVATGARLAGALFEVVDAAVTGR